MREKIRPRLAHAAESLGLSFTMSRHALAASDNFPSRSSFWALAMADVCVLAELEIATATRINANDFVKKSQDILRFLPSKVMQWGLPQLCIRIQSLERSSLCTDRKSVV